MSDYRHLAEGLSGAESPPWAVLRPTMTGTWQTLCSLLSEAKSAADYKNDLLKLITRRFGEHEADEVTGDMRRLGGFKSFRDHMATKYMSTEIDKIIKDMGVAAAAGSAAKEKEKSGEKGGRSKSDEPDVQGATRGPSGRQFMDPETAADKQARIDAMRAARQGAGSGGGEAGRALMTPGTKQAHAMGTAGVGKTKDQPSLSTGVVPQQHTPGTSKSGLVKAQRQVDRLTKEKGPGEGDRLAARLGVPTTKERTTTDRETGEERVQVWGPDKVFKFMGREDEPVPGASIGGRAVSMKGIEPKKAPDEPISRTDLIKMGALQRQAAGAPGEGRPKRPPSFDFEVWQAHGREGEKMVARPDQATGNWQRSKMQVNPSKTGRKWIGYKGQWHTEDEMERMFPGKGKTLGGSKGLVNRAQARTGTVPMQGRPTSPAADDDDDEYPADQGWRKA